MTLYSINYHASKLYVKFIQLPFIRAKYFVLSILGLKMHEKFIHQAALLSSYANVHVLYGMTIRNEQKYFNWYAQNIYLGKGSIVDLGCWLGSTTIPLVQGLMVNRAVSQNMKKVYAYDLFQWVSWMDGMKNSVTAHLKEGDDFISVFQHVTKDYQAYIEVEKADLTKYQWKKGDIEFLLVDAMKSEELAEHISKQFYPHLIPGSSYLLHQDYAHFYTPWIHLLQYTLRDYFEFVYHVYDTPSVVFKCKKRVPDALLEQTYVPTNFTDDFVRAAFDYSLQWVSGHPRNNVAAAHCMYYVHKGDKEKAREMVNNYISRGYSRYSEMNQVIAALR